MADLKKLAYPLTDLVTADTQFEIEGAIAPKIDISPPCTTNTTSSGEGRKIDRERFFDEGRSALSSDGRGF